MKARPPTVAVVCDIQDGPCWTPWCPACRNTGEQLCPDCSGTGHRRGGLVKCGACDGLGFGCGLDHLKCDGVRILLPVVMAVLVPQHVECWAVRTGGRGARNPKVIVDEWCPVTELCAEGARPAREPEPCLGGPRGLDDDPGYWDALDDWYSWRAA